MMTSINPIINHETFMEDLELFEKIYKIIYVQCP
jgi:hypothetical protein